MKVNLLCWFCLILLVFACKRKDTITPLPDLPVYTDSSYLEFFRQNNGITAAQHARSVPLSDGRILWLFDHAHLNDMNMLSGKISCQEEAYNAAALQQGMNWTTLNSSSADFIPTNEWGNPLYLLHAYQYFDTIFIFCKKEKPREGFTHIAKVSFPALQFLRLDSIKTPYQFGYSIVPDTAKGFCYVYGLPFNTSINNSVYVARMPLNSPHALWTYFTGSDFVNSQSGLVPIHTSEYSHFSVRKVNNKFVCVNMKHSGRCDKAAEIFSSVSAYPYGTFLNEKKLYTINENLSQHKAVTGFPCLHSFATNTQKEILLTYSINGFMPCLNTCDANETNPDFHRTKTIRVPMRNIDATW